MVSCITVDVVTPENVTSDLLTVDNNNCNALCTVTGNARWTNSGGVESIPTDLKITVDGVPTILATGVVIAAGGTTTTYPFTISNMVKGIYTISTIPSGAADQIITVVNPANIVAKTITSNKTSCTAPCSLTVDVTWENTGDVAGNFVPNINIDGIPTTPTYTSESLEGLTTSAIKTFTVTLTTATIHTICPNPN